MASPLSFPPSNPISYWTDEIVKSFGTSRALTLPVVQRMAEADWLNDPKLTANQRIVGQYAEIGFKMEALNDFLLYAERPDAALERLQKLNLSVVLERHKQFWYLFTFDAQFLMTVDELADRLGFMVGLLEKNRSSLLEIGLPAMFPVPWLLLDLVILRNYYLKLPSVVSGVRVKGNEHDFWELTYDWSAKLSALDVYEIPGRWRHIEDNEFSWLACRTESGQSSCIYDQANVIEQFLSEERKGTIPRIEGLRRKILDLKIELLTVLSKALKSRDPKRLWEDCLTTLTKHLTWEDVDFLLKVDHWYRNNTILPGEIASGSSPQRSDFNRGYRDGVWLNGGLSDLLWLIGLCEEELVVGRSTKIRRALIRRFGEIHQVEEEIDLFDWTINFPLGRLNYFYYFDSDDQGAIDSALNFFVSCEQERKDFWSKFTKRVNKALQDEFEQKFEKSVVIQATAKRKFMHKFEPDVGNFIDYYKKHIEEGGKAHDFRFVVPKAERNKPFVYQFKQDGKKWHVSFEGENAEFETDIDGFFHIRFLVSQRMKHGKADFFVTEIERALKGDFSIERPWLEDFDPKEEEDTEDGDPSGLPQHPSPVGRELTTKYTGKKKEDREAEDRLWNRKIVDATRDLEIRMSHLEESKDKENQDEYERMKKVYRVLVAFRRYGKGSRIKSVFKDLDSFHELNPEYETVRTRVKRAIDRAIDKIERKLPKLARHLGKHIETGIICSYDPPYREDWEF